MEPSGSGEERENLGSLLKRGRIRLDAGSFFLGDFPRLPSRVGKGITQQEVAEAAGITREWYSSIESGNALRVSAVTLGRIATALVLTPAERTRAFQLAVPEFAPAVLSSDSIDALDSFSFVRRCAKRLLSATSVDEILALARTFTAERVGSDVVIGAVRRGEDDWNVSMTTRGAQLGTEEYELFRTALIERHGAGIIDDMHAYTAPLRPGEVLAKEELDVQFRSRAETLNPFYALVGLQDHRYLMTAIVSRQGLVGRLMPTYTRGGEFSKIDLAVLGTVANLASLALSS